MTGKHPKEKKKKEHRIGRLSIKKERQLLHLLPYREHEKERRKPAQILMTIK